MTSNFSGIKICLFVIKANLNCDGAHQRKGFILNISPLMITEQHLVGFHFSRKCPHYFTGEHQFKQRLSRTNFTETVDSGRENARVGLRGEGQ